MRKSSRMTRFLRPALALAAALASAAPSAASAQAAAALFATRAEADAAFFVLEEFLDGAASLDAIAALYADSVDYFALGPQPRDQVLAFRRDFLSRWSERTYDPDLATLVVQRDGDDRFSIRIEVDFTLLNAATQLSGRSLVDLTVERRGERFVVIREAGDVLVQE